MKIDSQKTPSQKTHSQQSRISQRIIGLTGGIGMGKSTVSDYLATVHQLPILDADILAREAVATHTPVFYCIVERYGSGILLADGTLNRQRLSEIVFNSVAERLWLEQQIHPYVRDRIEQAIHTPPLYDTESCPTVVLVIPLLFEARMTDLVTETWVVECDQNTQMERLMQRDGLSEEQARARINSQMAIQKKIAYADVVLNNNSTRENLLQQVDVALSHQPKPVIVTHKRKSNANKGKKAKDKREMTT